MQYIACKFELEPFTPFNEILVAELSQFPFESFEEEGNSVIAYITETEFNKDYLEEISLFNNSAVQIKYSTKLIPKENWNAKWEASFSPVEIGEFCIIRAPFHQATKQFVHDIIIEPKMSFGTGHHATTQLMVLAMSSLDFNSKTVLDMGSGTGVLAILAEKMGAQSCDAIDIEDWAYENIKENLERNQSLNVKPYLGDASLLSVLKGKYNIVIANINKNILLRDMDAYINQMEANADLLLSGFFKHDASELIAELQPKGLKFLRQMEQDDWCMLHFKFES